MLRIALLAFAHIAPLSNVPLARLAQRFAPSLGYGSCSHYCSQFNSLNILSKFSIHSRIMFISFFNKISIASRFTEHLVIENNVVANNTICIVPRLLKRTAVSPVIKCTVFINFQHSYASCFKAPPANFYRAFFILHIATLSFYPLHHTQLHIQLHFDKLFLVCL